MRRWIAVLLLSAVAGSAAAQTASPAPSPTAAPASSATPAPKAAARAPFDNPPVALDTITIVLDMRAARAILALLSRDRFEAADAKLLETLPAVGFAIRDSNRPPETFQRDLAAAFDEQARITMFDFRRIREDRSRWDELLAMISTHEAELTRLTADRARALLPSQPAVTVTVLIDLTFGLSGRADHIVVPATDGEPEATLVDLARALSEAGSATPAEQIRHLSRLMASEAYQRAWGQYRAGSPAWTKRDQTLGQLEPLLYSVAAAGPVSLYTVDENFFPLSVWLKDRMKASLDEMNRVADRLVSTEGDLDQRVALVAEVRRPEFASRVAGPAGAFLADGIVQTLGLDAYRAALYAGPRAFFEAYDRAAAQKGRALIPLAKVIRDRLAGAPPPHS
jgi:hypothetical protein